MEIRRLWVKLVGLAALLVLTQGLLSLATSGSSASSSRNVIFFHIDGYGLSHWNALRAYLAGPDGRLNWDQLPYWGLYTGHTKNSLTGSSHGTLTANAYGVRVPWNSYGMYGDQRAITALSGQQMSIMEEAINAGFATALVNSASVTDPGTGVFVASAEGWGGYEEGIAKQIIESGVEVILGGGEGWLLPEGLQGRHGVGRRTDGVNLIERARELGYTVVFTRDELMIAAADPAITRVLGVFAHKATFNALNEEALRARQLPLYWPWAPTTAEMSAAAIEILSRNAKAAERGIFLVAEEEATDDFPNATNARGSFEAGRRADEALRVFAEFSKNNANTLLVTTADSNAGGKHISGADLQTMMQLGAVAEGNVTKAFVNTNPEGTRGLAPLDGVDGAGTPVFWSAPDEAGVRHPFVVGWVTNFDVVGDVVVRAKGLNARPKFQLPKQPKP
jgi:alkaline phosphatase